MNNQHPYCKMISQKGTYSALNSEKNTIWGNRNSVASNTKYKCIFEIVSKWRGSECAFGFGVMKKISNNVDFSF